MRRLLMIGLACGISFTARAQYVTQSAEGKGSVLLPLRGPTVGFDIGKTEISVGINNYTHAVRDSNMTLFKNWFVGGNLAVKNSSGTGNLFKGGDIVPEGNFLGFLGFSINNNAEVRKNWRASDLKVLSDKQDEERLDLRKAYQKDVAGFICAASTEISDQDLRAKTTTALKKLVLGAADGMDLNDEIGKILTNGDQDLKGFTAEFARLLAPRKLVYLDALALTYQPKKTEEFFRKFASEQRIWRLTPFLFGGIEARNFSYFKGISAFNLSSSFVDTLYRGGQFGLGINMQFNTFWLGVTYAYIDGDNFINLSSKEYNLKTTDNLNNQSLSSEKKITGYSGAYSKVKRNELNVDLLKEFSFTDTSRVIVNLYYRGSLYSRNTDYLKDYSNAGIGLYFLGAKNKFLGGLYVEVPDLNNNIERAKPVLEQNIREPFKKLTFGVVTKFAISSVFGFRDRARKPD